MKVKIYGRKTGCKFCTYAKNLCDDWNKNLDNDHIDLEFIDIDENNIDIDELKLLVGKDDIKTIPQIFVDDNYIGGSDKFYSFLVG